MPRVHNLGGFLEKMEDWSTIFGKVQYLLQHSLFLGKARKEGNIELFESASTLKFYE